MGFGKKFAVAMMIVSIAWLFVIPLAISMCPWHDISTHFLSKLGICSNSSLLFNSFMVINGIVFAAWSFFGLRDITSSMRVRTLGVIAGLCLAGAGFFDMSLFIHIIFAGGWFALVAVMAVLFTQDSRITGVFLPLVGLFTALMVGLFLALALTPFGPIAELGAALFANIIWPIVVSREVLAA